LIIQGREDEHASPKHALDAMEAIPKASLWIAAGVDHMLPQAIPEVLNQRLVEFWKGW
jgi:pimeloyl-ACP methyl ester carboxylesterase